jgi:hypothetical protein
MIEPDSRKKIIQYSFCVRFAIVETVEESEAIVQRSKNMRFSQYDRDFVEGI